MNAVLQAGLAVKLVTFRAHWHGPSPEPGDYVRSASPRARAAYRIVSVRPTQSTRWPLRLRCERVAPASIPEDARVHQWRSDRPMRRRAPLRSPLL